MPNTVFGLECIESNIYIGDRAGIIAITQLPLIFAFTARNNLFSVITGWPYRTFNIFHRWISRFVVVLIFLHAIFYYDSARRNGDYIQRWGLTKWRFAHVGILSGFILGITSVYPFRNKFYEAFKSCHQVFSILFIVGTWYHCVTLGWMEFLYVTIGLWGLDHMIRFFKIMVSGGVVAANCELIISKRDSFGSLSSEIAVGHTIKVTINHSGYWRHYPGCYVFVYFLKPNMFWQSHPFTTIEPSVVQAANQLVLLIRVKEGVTSQLSEFLLSQPEYKAKISVLVEGPYGSPIGFRGYQNAIFVAGGIGITVVYTLALDLARQHKAEILRGDAKASDRSVTLYWITPSIESIESSVDEIAAMSEIGCLNLKIFITRQHGFSLPHNRGIPSFIDLLSTKPEKNRLGGIQSATLEMCIPSFVQESGSKDSIVLDELSPLIYANMLYGEIGSFNDTPPFTQHREEQVKAATPSGKGSSRVSHTQEFSWAGTPPLTLLKPSDKLQLYHDILLENLPRVEIKWGVKPSMKTEIVENVGKLSGTTAVVACGPDRLNCDTRDGTIKAMRDSGNERIDYFEEKLLW
ncbi:hypothetical protein BABINDRAFT_159838 [Babjeviella inositovora NRRL Y-12698]|uniref:FAD-binding FR-type domain-containing protein n=1 Tax=Babjeviella inositovora NRRL Y-12698 TaxID=984486 RepID=A0A1E3QV66_9ASCO|nr:uncharacterized protein BABINDRAFT_159838 [Babjeviella inositovora NRRL Y-12698]ODQ81563.1 hypothetical protein BABINDRAFT_159838 [Babjeviella inositovora NRRL Y-12698]